MIDAKILAIIVSISVLVFVIELIRREKLTFKYGVGWIFLSGMAVFFSIFDQLLEKIATGFGFELTSNFIFFTLLGIFVFLSLLLTVFVYQQEKRNNLMAQKLGILESELKKYQQRNHA